MVSKMGHNKSSEKLKQKPKHKKGLWSPEEDQRLRNYVMKHGHACWSSVPINAGLQRNGKSCRLRWINYLRPGLKRGMFTIEEEDTVLTLHRMLGNKWSQIAQHLPGRTDNEIKNYWHSHLKKKISKTEQELETQNNITVPKTEYTTTTSTSENLDSSPSSNFPNFEFGQNITSSSSSPHSSTTRPKLLFAEWLSLENVNNYNPGFINPLGDQFGYNPQVSGFGSDSIIFNEGGFGNEFQDGVGNVYIDEMLNNPRFKFEDTQVSGFGFGESGEDLYFDVNNVNNVMYI